MKGNKVSDIPKFVEFREEGPREGFQAEKRIYSVEEKVSLIEALSETGLRRIQIGSFVSAQRVPNMANTPEVARSIRRRPGIRYTALWLNKKGFEDAAATKGVDLSGMMALYTTDAFCKRNNNCTVDEMRERQLEWLAVYDAHHLPFEVAGITTAFGCNFAGEVPVESVLASVRFVADICQAQHRPLPIIYLADTVGWANPEEVKRRVGAVRELVPQARIGLHLHDTRGLGPANFYAALQMGVDCFDSSVAGLGGCPFAAHANLNAAGNICTEDMVFMCHEMGIETGLDLEKLIEAARLAEQIVGRTLNGHLMHSGSLRSFRC